MIVHIRDALDRVVTVFSRGIAPLRTILDGIVAIVRKYDRGDDVRDEFLSLWASGPSVAMTQWFASPAPASLKRSLKSADASCVEAFGLVARHVLPALDVCSFRAGDLAGIVRSDESSFASIGVRLESDFANLFRGSTISIRRLVEAIREARADFRAILTWLRREWRRSVGDDALPAFTPADEARVKRILVRGESDLLHENVVTLAKRVDSELPKWSIAAKLDFAEETKSRLSFATSTSRIALRLESDCDTFAIATLEGDKLVSLHGDARTSVAIEGNAIEYYGSSIAIVRDDEIVVGHIEEDEDDEDASTSFVVDKRHATKRQITRIVACPSRGVLCVASVSPPSVTLFDVEDEGGEEEVEEDEEEFISTEAEADGEAGE